VFLAHALLNVKVPTPRTAKKTDKVKKPTRGKTGTDSKTEATLNHLRTRTAKKPIDKEVMATQGLESQV
jgi:hypothetical protein